MFHFDAILLFMWSFLLFLGHGVNLYSLLRYFHPLHFRTIHGLLIKYVLHTLFADLILCLLYVQWYIPFHFASSLHTTTLRLDAIDEYFRVPKQLLTAFLLPRFLPRLINHKLHRIDGGVAHNICYVIIRPLPCKQPDSLLNTDFQYVTDHDQRLVLEHSLYLFFVFLLSICS